MLGVFALARVFIFAPLPARCDELGGHDPLGSGPPPHAVGRRPENRTVLLEEMWQRRLLSTDQSSWSPSDAQLLGRIREAEPDAIGYLKKKFGGTRPWTVFVRSKGPPRLMLTRAGYEKYLLHLTQDAIRYFEAKGADAKWALKLTDWDGKRLFSPAGLLTEAGIRVYQRAKLKLEVYWKSPNGETFGTRRPPAARQ